MAKEEGGKVKVVQILTRKDVIADLLAQVDKIVNIYQETPMEAETSLGLHENCIAVSNLILDRLDATMELPDISLDLQRRSQKVGTLNLKLMCTFALAAWIEMSERWFDMPENPQRNLKMVCNLCPLQIRQLAVHVDDEYRSSCRPMFDHCCATCGRLLFSSTTAGGGHNPNEVGVAGFACQMRGTATTWDTMPLCLLLWSKKRLAETLFRGIGKYDAGTNTLTLTGGPEVAPWLHFTKGHPKSNATYPHFVRDGLPYVMDASTPWWYCRICHRYWICNDPHRLPMRNRLEGLYTRWHIDLAFPHLHTKLRQLYPELKTLPTVAEALQWRTLYAEYVKECRLPDEIKNEERISEMQTQLLEWDCRYITFLSVFHIF